MADSQNEKRPDHGAAEFEGRIAELQRGGIPSANLDRVVPWSEIPESGKLARLVAESRVVTNEDGTLVPGVLVPGAVALEAIERHIDFAGLPDVQQEMLHDMRAALDAGLLDVPYAGNKDHAALALARIVGAVEFDRRLGMRKVSEGRPWDWAKVPEDWKVGMLVDMAVETGPLGAYTLAAIEREVDYSSLSPWRREALEGLRARLDQGELEGDVPSPSYRGDRADYALRMAELERVEDAKRFDSLYFGGKRLTWQELSEGQKLERIAWEMHVLDLGGEGEAYEIIDREVDLAHVPHSARQAVEKARQEAWHTPQESEYLADEALPEHDPERRRGWKSPIERAALALEIASEKESLGLTGEAEEYRRRAAVWQDRADLETAVTSLEAEWAAPERDALLQETYRLNKELGYVGFRDQYLNDPEAVKEWPDHAVREQELRHSWDNQSHVGFDSYQKSYASVSVWDLAAYRDFLHELLAGDQDGQIAYFQQASALGRSVRTPVDAPGEVKAASRAFPSPGDIADDVRARNGALKADSLAQYDSTPETIALARVVMRDIKEALSADARGNFPAKYADVDWDGMNLAPPEIPWQDMGMSERYLLLKHALNESIWSHEPSANWGEASDSEKLANEFVKDEMRDLYAEVQHDTGLRHMEDRGVTYEGVGDAFHHAARGAKGQVRSGEQQGKRLPSPGDIAGGAGPETPSKSNGPDLDHPRGGGKRR